MLFGQIGFQCPYDGQVQAGFDCIEDMVVHEEGKTEISVRCPKCGTLVRIASQAPIIPPNIIEQLAQELSVSMKDGKLNFSDLMSQVTGSSTALGIESEDDSCNNCQNIEELADRELTPSEGNQVEYFARELEKIESVDDFLTRVNEETR
ncbi:MAG: hypothetical protein FWC86_00055 [Coriobacteriia bacterium]|nr:hypothetical protein [Coriobacteriia bacterium]